MNWPAEEWREIAGSPGYEVSSRGEVRSPSGRVLRPWKVGYGYLCVGLGRDRRSTVHALVCAAFHGARPEGMVVAHYDGDCTNNRAENLRWATPSENMKDMVRHGRHNPRNYYKPGQKKRGFKATRHPQADEIVAARKAGETLRAMAARFGMSKSGIYGVLRKRVDL